MKAPVKKIVDEAVWRDAYQRGLKDGVQMTERRPNRVQWTVRPRVADALATGLATGLFIGLLAGSPLVSFRAQLRLGAAATLVVVGGWLAVRIALKRGRS